MSNVASTARARRIPPSPREPRGTLWLALLGTLFVHILLIVLIRSFWVVAPAEKDAAKEPEQALYEVSLVEPEAMRYVETNPEAPENEPDRTERYSFRAQQSADEVAQEDSSDAPKVEGDLETQKIVQGQLEQSPALEASAPVDPSLPGEGPGREGGEAGARSEVVPPVPAQPLPLPDFIDQEAVAEKGPGSRPDTEGQLTEIPDEIDPEAPIDLYQRPREAVDSSLRTSGGGSPQTRPQPRARPRLAPELVTGPLMRSESSASRRGSLAIDATFSEFGEYEQQFYAAVQTGWYQEIDFFQPIDTATRVQVKFTLHADGQVSDVEAVHTTASEIATFICEAAISKRSPFRPWTREMREVFGDERTLRVVFHYR